VLFAIAGCADPAAEQAKRAQEAERFNLIAEALFYRSCASQAVQIAGQCRPWREAYERDLAAFKAKYGDDADPSAFRLH
jgi:hypothetical protein